MTNAEGYEAFIKPSVDALTTPVKGPFDRVGNFLLKNISKGAILNMYEKAIKDEK